MNAFEPQVLAAIVGGVAGGVIGLIGVVFTIVWQTRAEYRRGVDEAVAQLLIACSDFARELDGYRTGPRTGSVITHMQARPRGYDVSIAVELLVIRTHGRDRDFALALSRAWDVVAHVKNPAEQGTALGLFAGSITTWRVDRSAREARRRLGNAIKAANGGADTED